MELVTKAAWGGPAWPLPEIWCEELYPWPTRDVRQERYGCCGGELLPCAGELAVCFDLLALLINNSHMEGNLLWLCPTWKVKT
jgi:hypothetical protein